MLGTHPPAFRPAAIVLAALLFLTAAAAMIWYAFNIQHDKIESNRTESEAVRASVSVLYSTADIARGQILRRADFSARDLEPAKVPQGALQNAVDVEGHVATDAIAKDTPILASKISAGALAGVSAHVPLGYRAYALPVSEAAMAGGFVQVGDHVDLYVTLPGALFAGRDVAGRRLDDQSKSTMLIQGVEVLAVGTKLATDGKADTTARTVTLCLPSESLAKVALADRIGKVSFAVRNPADETPADAAPADLDVLVSARRPQTPVAATPVAAPSGRGIVVYAGAARSVVPVP